MGAYVLPDGTTTTSLTEYDAAWDTELDHDEAVTSTEDMKKLFKWKYGDTLYGTDAKKSEGMKEYIDDINEAYGQQDNYKPYYINTFSLKNWGKEVEKSKPF